MIRRESSTVPFHLLCTGALRFYPYSNQMIEIYGETYVIYEIYYIALDMIYFERFVFLSISNTMVHTMVRRNDIHD